MFTNVIAGVDGFDGGRDAVALAKALATGRLELLNAYPHDAIRSRGSLAGFDELLRAGSERLLEAARLEAGVDAGVDAGLVVAPDASPAHALQQAAEDRG